MPDPRYLQLNPFYPGLRRVYESPPVYVVDNFLSDTECERLQVTATPLLQRSKTHSIVGSEATRGRTSLTCHLAKRAEPCPRLLHKIQALTGLPQSHMELVQVSRYTAGQRYVDHYDGVDPATAAGKNFCASGGQRIGTVLVYLNDIKGGGGSTHFSRLNLEISPVKGMALIFFPGFLSGELDTNALHAGRPPLADTKWVSQVWIRQSAREDGQPSLPASPTEQLLYGPLHAGLYAGMCVAGDDVFEADMTFEEAKAWAASCPTCEGFTFASSQRMPILPTRVWFKSKMVVLYQEGWWSFSVGTRN